MARPKLQITLDEEVITPFEMGSPYGPTALENLELGRRFKFADKFLNNFYRKLYIIRISSSSVTIKGEKRDDIDGLWTTLGSHYHVANSCSVIGL